MRAAHRSLLDLPNALLALDPMDCIRVQRQEHAGSARAKTRLPVHHWYLEH